MSSPAEDDFVALARKRCLKTLRNGWPDFFVKNLKTKEFLGVEVKRDSNGIRPAQRVMFAALEAYGLKVVIWNPARPKLFTPWRAYDPKKLTVKKKKKTKSVERIVTYVRMRHEDFIRIAQIVKKRGLPHTIASVVAEMISRGLVAEAAAGKEAPRG